ncbi:MAG: hypothetical protein QUU85_11000, partial [Candidatus Eisenbacteria bacterium]|nr:hypothetical protein [Candidatus Eisenbacteria bacterium]
IYTVRNSSAASDVYKRQISFLQGMLTQDVAGMRPGESRLACLLERKGHLLAPLRLLRLEDGAHLVLDSSTAAGVLAILHQFHFLESLAIDRREDQRLLLLTGPGSDRVPPARGVEFWKVREVGPNDRLLLLSEGNGLEEALAQADAVPIGSETLERLRIEAGRPLFGKDVDGALFPMEAGLEEAVHYQKGCYVGQETIARIHFQGKVHRALLGIRFAAGSRFTAASAFDRREGHGEGPEVFLAESGSEPLGRLTSFAPSRTGGDDLGLAVLRIDAPLAGREVTAGGVTGTVEALPFAESGLPRRAEAE